MFNSLRELVKMMEDAGEDVLRQKPNIVVTFFKRIGQVGSSISVS